MNNNNKKSIKTNLKINILFVILSVIFLNVFSINTVQAMLGDSWTKVLANNSNPPSTQFP